MTSELRKGQGSPSGPRVKEDVPGRREKHAGACCALELEQSSSRGAREETPEEGRVDLSGQGLLLKVEASGAPSAGGPRG